MKQQTAVEWLEHELGRRQGIIDSEPEGIVKQSMYANLYVDLFEKAKQIEKQQIIDARVSSPMLNFSSKKDYIDEAEKYYKKTYTDETT